MQVLFINKELESSFISEAIDYLSQKDASKPLSILFSCGGGDPSYVGLLFEAISEFSEIKIIIQQAGSAAFDLLISLCNLENTKLIIFNDYFNHCMTHCSDIDLSSRQLLLSGENYPDNIIFESCKELLNNQIKEASDYLNEKELALFKKGEFVYLNKQRTKEILINRGAKLTS